MADDLYEDGDEASPAKSKDEGAATALLPKDFFPETPEVGKICKVRVERLTDEQAVVSYVKDEKKSEPEEAPEMETDAEMESLMS